MVQPFTTLGVKPVLFWVSVSPEVRKERLINRGAERDREKLSSIDAYLSQNPTVAPAVAHVPINGEGDFAQQVKDND